MLDTLYSAYKANPNEDNANALFGGVRELAQRRLNNADAAQQVTLTILEGIGSYQRVEPFAHWVNTVIKGNYIVDCTRNYL
jgi:hypothetical protein